MVSDLGHAHTYKRTTRLEELATVQFVIALSLRGCNEPGSVG
jgi:hypothetical protein